MSVLRHWSVLGLGFGLFSTSAFAVRVYQAPAVNQVAPNARVYSVKDENGQMMAPSEVKKGQKIRVGPEALGPTQVAVGTFNVNEKLASDFAAARRDYTKRRYLAAYAEKNGIPAPDGFMKGKLEDHLTAFNDTLKKKGLDHVTLDEVVAMGKSDPSSSFLRARGDLSFIGDPNSSLFKNAFVNYIRNDPKMTKFPGVISPDGKVHITDGHHRALELWITANRNKGTEGVPPIEMTVEISENYAAKDGESEEKKWERFLVNLCRQHQVYFDPATRESAANEIAMCKSDVTCPTSAILRRAFKKAIPRNFAEIPHSPMRSLIGWGLPDASKYDPERKDVRVSFSNDAFKDYFEFYVGEKLQKRGLRFPKMISFQDSPKLAEKIQYARTLLAVANMRDIMMTDPTMKAEILALAKPGKEKEAEKAFEAAEKAYASVVAQHIQERRSNPFDPLGLACPYPRFKNPCANPSTSETQATELSKSVASIAAKIDSNAKEDLFATGSCLKPHETTPEILVGQQSRVPELRVLDEMNPNSKNPRDLELVSNLIKYLEKGFTPGQVCTANP